MSISTDDIIQVATGNWNATSGTVTLPSGTTDGNTVIMFFASSGGPQSTGFTRDHSPSTATVRTYILRKSNVTAGENNFSVTGWAVATPVVWVAIEIQGLHKLNTLEFNSALPNAATSGTTFTTSTSSSTAAWSYERIEFALHAGSNTANSTVPTWSGHTNDFVSYQQSSRVDGATALSAAVSVRVAGDIASSVSTAATSSVTVTGNCVLVAYNAAAARREPNVDVMSGAEHGTAAGLATGAATNPPFDVVNGSVAVSTSSPRSGSYCYRLAGASAAANMSWSSTGALSLYPASAGFTAHRQYCARFSVRFPGSLPAGDVGIAAFDAGTGTSASGMQLTYRSATQQFGLLVVNDVPTAGTEVLATPTLVADTWYDIDVYLDMTNAARQQQFAAYWRVDNTDQTTATVSTSTASTVATFTRFRLGWLTSTSATVDYDDIVGSKHPGHFPLGSIRIYPIAVDPAGTVTATTPASFSTMTANGTLNSTFAGATARDAIDEVPVVVGASADGFVQDTIGASDYVAVPMATRSASGSLQALRAARFYVAGWAAGNPAAATFGLRAHDGTAEYTLAATADPAFTNSTTTPAWLCRMMRTTSSATPYQWTQAALDAMTARLGFSGDVTPNIGVNALMLEVAMRDAEQIQAVEADGVFCYYLLDPDRNTIVAMKLVAPVDGAAWAQYVVNGVTIDRNAPAGTTDTYTIGAETQAVVSYVSAGRS